jgi:hypothetical protein
MKKKTKSTIRKAAKKVARIVTTVAKTEGEKALRTIIDTGIQRVVSGIATTEPEPATPDFKAGRDL